MVHVTAQKFFLRGIIFFFVMLPAFTGVQAQFIKEVTSFGTQGAVKTKILENTLNPSYGCALDDQGRLLVVGIINYVENNLAKNYSFVSRFLANGELDHSFAVDGTWKAEIGLYGSGAQDIVFHKGKILISGYSYTGVNNMSELFVLRLTQDGILDNSFSGDGIAMTGIQRYILDCGTTSLSVLNDDKIALQWYARYHTSLYGTNYIDRLHWDGTYDTSFDQDGHFEFTSLASVLVKPMCAVAMDGRFTITARESVSPYTGFARSFNADGSPAQTENLLYPDIYNPQCIRYDESGNAYIAFQVSDNTSMKLAKIKPDGSLDLSFGTNGIASVPFNLEISLIEKIMFIQDRIMVIGTVLSNSTPQAAIAMFHTNGETDNNFGTAGAMVRSDPEGSYLKGMVYNSSSQELFFCGTFGQGSTQGILLLKYKTDLPITTPVLADQQLKSFTMRLSAEQVWIDNPGAIKGKAEMTIYDLQGKRILTEALYMDGLQTTTIPFAQSLQPGIYVSTLNVGTTQYCNKGLVE